MSTTPKENAPATSQGASEPPHQESPNFSTPRRVCTLGDLRTVPAAECEAHQARKAERGEEINFALWEADTAHAQGNVDDAEYADWVREIGREFDLPLTTPEELAAMAAPSTEKEAAHLQAAQTQQEALHMLGTNWMPSGIGGLAPIGPNTRRIIETFLLTGQTSGYPLDYFDSDRWHLIGAAADPNEAAIRSRLDTLEVDAEARRRFNETRSPTPELPPVKSLTDLLAEPDADTPYRIEGLATEGSRVMLVAQYKAGKSTMLHGNLIPALADGGQFLGQFPVNTTASGIVLIDNELDEDMLRSWLRRARIENTDAIADVVALRGKVGSFNLLDDKVRTRLARRFADVGCDYLILDCLRPVLDALGLDEHRDGGQFLTAFDALLDEAGIRNALTVQHMGHTGERARGDSRFQDWPDQTWRMIRDDPDDPSSPRFFTAFGRECEVAEGALTFDQATGRYTYAAGSRREAAAAARTSDALHHVIVALVDSHLSGADGLKRQALVDQLSVHHRIGRNKVDDAIARGVADGVVDEHVGMRNAKIYRLANPCQACGHPVSEPGRDVHRECS